MLAGLRFDTQTYDGSGDAAQVAPRLNVLYDLERATRLRASWGRFFQAQGINELQVEDGVDRFLSGAARRPRHCEPGSLAGAGLDLRIEAYRKDYRHTNPRFENLFNPLVLLPEIEFDRVMIDPDSARAEGVEVMLRMAAAGRMARMAWLFVVAGDGSYRWPQRHAQLGSDARRQSRRRVGERPMDGHPDRQLSYRMANDPSFSVDCGRRRCSN